MKIVKIIATMATILGITMFAAPASIAAPSHDRTNPVSTGCVKGAYVLSGWGTVNTKYNQVQGRMQLMYSPTCQTNWINVYGDVSGNTYTASINVGPAPMGGALHASVKNIGSDFSYQVYAPGSTCVTVGWSIHDNATGAVEGSDSRVFLAVI